VSLEFSKLNEERNRDSSISFSVPDVQSFQMIVFALCSSMHTVCSIRIVMADSTVTNQLVNKICLSAPLSTHFEKVHRPRIEFVRSMICENFSLKKGSYIKGFRQEFYAL
jgi:hypothetical protein